MTIRKTPATIRTALYDIVNDMAMHNEAFVKRPGKDFSRERICSFTNVILNIITKESHSLNRELANHYNVWKKQPPTKSAFCQARQKIKPESFLYLLKTFNDKFPFKKTYKGLHLLACDGTDSNIPADSNDTASFISYNSKQGGYYQFHTVVMYDLLENRYTDAVIQPRKEISEINAFCDMIDRNSIEGKCLYIADRGFVGYSPMFHAQQKGHYYLIRVKEADSVNSPFKNISFPSDGDSEANVTFVLTRKHSHPVDSPTVFHKWIHPSRSFDIIPPGDKSCCVSLPFRMVRLKFGHSFEYLITNLPADLASLGELKNLYHLRWNIETSFLFLKYGMAMNFFHASIRPSLMQEIFAKLVLSNFISLIVSCVHIPQGKTKYSYHVSFSDAIYKCRQFLLAPFSNTVLIKWLCRDKVPIRPGRSSDRNMRSQVLKSLQNRN